MKAKMISCGGLGTAALFLVSCSFARVRPCTSGGQPAHDTPMASIGVQKCTQVTDPVSGKIVNEGKYYEWYENEVLAVEEEFLHDLLYDHLNELDMLGLLDQFKSPFLEKYLKKMIDIDRKDPKKFKSLFKLQFSMKDYLKAFHTVLSIYPKLIRFDQFY